jgi:hypothetical protein
MTYGPTGPVQTGSTALTADRLGVKSSQWKHTMYNVIVTTMAGRHTATTRTG